MLEKYGTKGVRLDHVMKGVKIRQRNCALKREEDQNFAGFCIDVKKKILIEKGGHRCSNCKLETWLDQPIPLELDHIDGNHNNRSKDNYRLLCPNCHAFTPTYRRRKNK